MIIFDSLIEGAQGFSDAEQGRFYKAVIDYVYFGKEPRNLSKAINGLFTAVKPSLDKSRGRAEAGRAGGKKSRKQTVSKTKANGKQNGKQNVREKEEEKEEEKEVITSVITPPVIPPLAESVVAYLNERTGKRFRADSESTVSLIGARAAEGYTLDDFKRVIDNRAAEWMGDAKMERFLQPSTLFRKTKFEGYLNERPAKEADDARIYDDLF
jgi:uncharacterized phage protein (TIGR02220 family)